MHDASTAEQQGLRAALRFHTADVHQRLDESVGAFETAAQYRAFVAQSYRFRLVAEAACRGNGLWEPLNLVDSLTQDLADLDLPFPSNELAPIRMTGLSEKLGALYVLEGSTLGARLLQRRAAELGFTSKFGARHLGLQSADNGRWKAFLQVLDRSEVKRQEALGAAQRMFETALYAYTEALHEPA